MTAEVRTSAPAARGASVHAENWGYCRPSQDGPSVEGFTLDIAPGERILLAGPSGAGKSTVLHGLAGLLDEEDGRSTGELTVDGRTPGKPGRAGLVQQDPDAQIVMSAVGDDVAFAAENLGIPREDIWRRVDEALFDVGLPNSSHRQASALSGGERQRMALAGVLVMRPGLLLLDEVTAQLDPEGVRLIRDAVISAADRTGATLVIVEHRMDPWIEAADTLVVLDHAGAVALRCPARAVHPAHGEHAVREDLVRRDLWVPGIDPLDRLPAWTRPVMEPAADTRTEAGTRGASPAPVSGQGHDGGTTGNIVLQATNLTVSQGSSAALAGIGMRILAQEAISIIGPNGAGKSTLLLTLAGLLPPYGGSLEAGPALLRDGPGPLPESPWHWGSPDLAARIGTVFQDPEHQFMHSTAGEELRAGALLASDRVNAGSGTEDPAASGVEARTQFTLDALDLSSLEHRNPYSLSGGEKRRLSLGIALIARPRLLILDEPSAGQDAGTFRALVQLLRAYLDSGGTIVTSTHDDILTRALEGKTLPIGAYRPELSSGCEDRDPDDGRARPQQDRSVRKRPAPSPPGPALPAVSSHSWLGRRNPLAKLAAVLIVTVALVCTMDWVSAAVVVLACCALLPAAGMSIRRFLRLAWPFAIGGMLMAWSTAVAGEDSGQVLLNLGYAQISEGSLTLGAALGMRAFAIVLPCILLMRTTSPTGLVDSLAQDLRVSSRFVLGTLAGMNVMGQLAGHWHVLGRSLRARGRLVHRGILPRLRLFRFRCFGILVMAVRKASRMAVSMEARGLGPGPRSWARPSAWSPADGLVALGGAAIAGTALSAALMTGTFTPAW